MEHERLRRLMVREQLSARGITDQKVLKAMADIHRHLFVDQAMLPMAYDDGALGIGDGQTVSQPYMVAKMTELLELGGGEKVLEVGTGSGYQTAVLASIAGEVFTIERIPRLSERARETLGSLGFENVVFRVGDGTLGWDDEGPFGRILVTAAAPALPPALLEQLQDGGIIVVPVGDRRTQVLVKVTKADGGLIREEHTPCVFVPLLGEQGWDDSGENLS